MNKIATSSAPAAIGPYSQGIECNGMIFVSGQLPVDPATGEFPEGDIQDLTRQSMKNICAILEAAGSSCDSRVCYDQVSRKQLCGRLLYHSL